MTQKYQNEKSPILNGQKKSKTLEKVQKMRDLEVPTSFRPFENTLYMNSHNNKVTETAGKYILLSTFNPYPETPTLYSWNHLDHQPLSI